MRKTLLTVSASVALLSSCSSIDDYHYGYAPAYRTLPEGFARVELGGSPYWHHGGRFYKHDAKRGYLLIKPPRGSEQIVATAGSASSPAPTASPVAAAPPQSADSGNLIRKMFTPGSGTLQKRDRPRRMGRSPIRRGTISSGE